MGLSTSIHLSTLTTLQSWKVIGDVALDSSPEAALRLPEEWGTEQEMWMSPEQPHERTSGSGVPPWILMSGEYSAPWFPGHAVTIV